jgi:hypothetical protein
MVAENTAAIRIVAPNARIWPTQSVVVPKALDTDRVIWHSGGEQLRESRVVMKKSLFAIIAAAFSLVLLSGSGARAYPYGDEPYTLNWEYYPQIQNGCWKWNWQQYQWNDFCPVYVHPKAYMFPRSRVVLRTRG